MELVGSGSDGGNCLDREERCARSQCGGYRWFDTGGKGCDGRMLETPLWIAHAEVRGPIFLVGQIEATQTAPFHPALRKVHVEPKGEKQDSFDVTCWLEIEGQYREVPADRAWSVAEDCFLKLGALLALMAWAPVEVRGKDVMTVGTLEGSEERRSVIYGKMQEVHQPVPIPGVGLLAKPLDRGSATAAVWLSRGMGEKDPVNRFLWFVFSCGLLGPRFAGARKRERRCQLCGQTEELQPGDAEYFQRFCEEAGIEHDQARRMWRFRCRLVHAAVEPTLEVRHEAARYAVELKRALHKVFERLVGPGILGPQSPVEMADLALLDLTFREKKTSPSGQGM